jgi:hypothetical protein
MFREGAREVPRGAIKEKIAKETREEGWGLAVAGARRGGVNDFRLIRENE